jgi:hypothetical protein
MARAQTVTNHDEIREWVEQRGGLVSRDNATSGDEDEAPQSKKRTAGAR